MDGSQFVLEIELPAPPATVHALLCDLGKLQALHPLIESVEELEPSAELPAARHYRVIDRIPFGPLHLRTAYRAALQSMGPSEVRGQARQFPAVRLETVYQLAATPSGTRLVERVRVQAPRLLRRFVTARAREAHAETLSRLRQLLLDPG